MSERPIEQPTSPETGIPKIKRSEINAIISEDMRFIESMGFQLPPFAYWTYEDWKQVGPESSEIWQNRLGWDITDFGFGDIEKCGLSLFTIRNGNLKNPEDKKSFAEKVLLIGEGQITPWHFHWQKMEDIINGGGGRLVIELANSTEDGKLLADTPVMVSIDGTVRQVERSDRVILLPGQSITLPPMLYHKFYGMPGYGRVFGREVSAVNDDETDNRFLGEVGRFPEIEEDVLPMHLLCSDYEKYIPVARN